MTAVDIDELKEIMDHDIELIQECFADFLVDYPDLLNGLKTAVSSLDFESTEDMAHKLKGSLKYLAAAPAAAAAQQLEQAGRNRDGRSLAEKLKALEVQCAQLICFIDEFSP